MLSRTHLMSSIILDITQLSRPYLTFLPPNAGGSHSCLKSWYTLNLQPAQKMLRRTNPSRGEVIRVILMNYGNFTLCSMSGKTLRAGTRSD